MNMVEVYRDFKLPLLAYFGRRLARPDDAEDLVQDVLMKLLRRGGGSDVQNARAYVFQVAANQLRDYIKGEGRIRRDPHAAVDAISPANAPAPLIEEVDPERIAIGKNELVAVRAALREVGERTSEVFLLYRVDGLKRSEIAERFGISVSMVEKHLARSVACIVQHRQACDD